MGILKVYYVKKNRFKEFTTDAWFSMLHVIESFILVLHYVNLI